MNIKEWLTWLPAMLLADPEVRWEALKYKQPGDEHKTLWVNATWFGDRLWAAFNMEENVYNAGVDTSLTRKGS